MTIDLRAAFAVEPPPLDFVWPGFLAGTVGALVAPGASGKSFFALQAAMAVACYTDGGDLLGLNPLRAGRVVYLAGEDPECALVRRIHAIGKHLSSSAREAIADNLSVEAIVGRRLDIMRDDHRARLIDYCVGARLLVLDTLSRIHALDENSNSDMSRLVAALEHVAARTGASVLYLHHVNKGSARDGQTDQQQAARGASALIDNARWCGFMSRMTDDEGARLTDRAYVREPIGNDRRNRFVRFGICKQNYGVTPLERWLERQDGGVLINTDLLDVRADRKVAEREPALRGQVVAGGGIGANDDQW